MTDPRRQRFAPYVRRLADLMGLRDWSVGISDEAPSGDSNARSDCLYGRKIVNLDLSDGFLDASPASQRQTIVHELLHAHFAAAAGIAETELDEASWRSFLRMLEYAIDGAADAWAPLLPLPDAAATTSDSLPVVNGHHAGRPIPEAVS